MIKSLLIALSYFYFHWQYFGLAAATLQRPRLLALPMACTFLVNYALFILCSVLELNLIFNWALFFLFLLLETVLYCKIAWRTALYLSLNGILYGLAVNIFCRCVVSIAIVQPLRVFDNNISSVGNLKAVPVFLGFLLGGLLLQRMAAPKGVGWLQTLISHPAYMSFQLELMGGMFLYLFLNLLLYQSQGNGVLLKLWGIKSCIFSIVGTLLGLRYSLTLCQLADYREQNRTIQRELAQSERQEAALRTIAYRDALTGVYNRQYALEILNALLERRAQFALCFLDLDHLKEVNDHYGHLEGDRYLTTVTEELIRVCRKGQDLLARFGGDEFLLLFPEAEASTVEERMRQADRLLEERSRRGETLFPMSVSYGVVDSGQAPDANALIALADEKMYQRKRAKAAKR